MISIALCWYNAATRLGGLASILSLEHTTSFCCQIGPVRDACRPADCRRSPCAVATTFAKARERKKTAIMTSRARPSAFFRITFTQGHGFQILPCPVFSITFADNCMSSLCGICIRCYIRRPSRQSQPPNQKSTRPCLRSSLCHTARRARLLNKQGQHALRCGGGAMPERFQSRRASKRSFDIKGSVDDMDDSIPQDYSQTLASTIPFRFDPPTRHESANHG